MLIELQRIFGTRISRVSRGLASITPGGGLNRTIDPNLKGPFVKGDLYIAVVGFDGTLLAYGSAVGERVGNNVMGIKDRDGKEVVKERIELAKKEQSFWQSYKFINPVSKTIEPKQMYCERLDETVVCGGVYQ